MKLPHCIMSTTLLTAAQVSIIWFTSISPAWSQSLPSQPLSQEEQYRWTHERWSTRDPYAHIRTTLDLALARNNRNESLLNQYQQQLAKRPRDPRTLFQWSYMFYRYSVQTQQRDLRRFAEVRRRFAQIASPRSYEYTRLRFIIEAIVFPSSALKGLGKRLLQRNPKDLDVNYYIIDMLNISQLQERKLALECANRLVQLNPQRPSSYSSLGWVHYRVWLHSRDAQTGQKAIAAYTRYLQLAPKGDSFRPHAQHIINAVRKARKST